MFIYMIYINIYTYICIYIYIYIYIYICIYFVSNHVMCTCTCAHKHNVYKVHIVTKKITSTVLFHNLFTLNTILVYFYLVTIYFKDYYLNYNSLASLIFALGIYNWFEFTVHLFLQFMWWMCIKLNLLWIISFLHSDFLTVSYIFLNLRVLLHVVIVYERSD